MTQHPAGQKKDHALSLRASPACAVNTRGDDQIGGTKRRQDKVTRCSCRSFGLPRFDGNNAGQNFQIPFILTDAICARPARGD
jgi:hypothetical protein